MFMISSAFDSIKWISIHQDTFYPAGAADRRIYL